MYLLKKSIEQIKKRYSDYYLSAITYSLCIMILGNSVLVEPGVYTFASKAAKIIDLLRYSSYLLLICLMGVNCFYIKKRIVCIILFLLSCMTFFYAGHFEMISYLLFVICGIGVDFEKIAKRFLLVQGIMLIGIVFLASTGIIENIVFDEGVRNRYSYGFSWCTTAPMLMLHITFLYFYIRERKIRINEIIALFFINTILLGSTNARFIYLMSCIYMIGACVVIYKNEWIKRGLSNIVIKCIIIVVPILCSVISLLPMFLYNPSEAVWIRLNAILSERLLYGSQAIEKYGMGLIGKQVEWIGYSLTKGYDGSYNYVDSSYLYILISFGIIFFTLTILGYTWLLRKSLKEQKYMLVLILVCICILGITERRMIMVMYNPMIILFGGCIDYYEEKLRYLAKRGVTYYKKKIN